MTYDIFGMGNALVDTEIALTDAELSVYGFTKGHMTLIQDDQREGLSPLFEDEKATKASGGSAANTMIGATQFGASCFYSCKIAHDALGHVFIQDLANQGIASNLNPMALPDGQTGTCLVFVTPDAERTLVTHLGISATYSKETIDEAALAKSKILYIEGYLVATPQGKEAMFHALTLAKQHGVKVALSFSDPFIVDQFKTDFEALLADGIDLLFCNQVEATSFANTNKLTDSYDVLKKVAKTFAVTKGKDGATIYHEGELTHVPAVPVDPVDTNGAGDLFAGVFMAHFIKGDPIDQCGRAANSASAQLITHFGPRLKLGKAS